ncbi:hypothetical protein EUX98_g1007 [Antrodiella citrinella]|uniref:MYND-type domain-containing protein n=1 Tax=Antrodiella citrinella TaxID=2447956 RepID=A0A4S4NBB7_9APHY|nr:hypothetical protein EUX98_g1007 [Antrodiella citrinella]
MANPANFDRVLKRMHQNPKSVLEAAIRGSPDEITVLGNTWADKPGLISPSDAMDVWLYHLTSARVPSDIKNDVFCSTANCAFASILELSDARRRRTLDVITMCWFTMAQNEVLRGLIMKTPAALEIATRLWLEEGKGPVPSNVTIPAASCILWNLLKLAKAPELDRMLKAAGGKAREVAKLSLTRLKDVLKAPQLSSTHLMMHLDFLNSVSRVPSHPIRRAPFGANVIWIVTGALVKLSVLVNTSPDLGFLDAMVAGFGYLSNCLESTDGFTWVSQAIGAGLLPAYCDCSPKFYMVHGEDLEMITDVVNKILPKYLVYRSVIDAVDASMRKLTKAQEDRVRLSMAKKGWEEFYHMAHEKELIAIHSEVTKGMHMTCDNIKCQKVKRKEEVRRCSACLNTFYCSKECQAVAWKEEGKSESISKRDAAFFHVLSMRDAGKKRQQFRKLIKANFPSAALHDTVVCMDYTVLPAKSSVRLLKDYNTGHTMGSDNAEARNDALVEKVQTHPDRFTLIESKIACGQGHQCVLTLATGQFWTRESMLGPVDDLSGDDAELGHEDMDHIDFMKVQMMLDSFKDKHEGERRARV